MIIVSSRPKFDSRKATPWDSKEELTPMEAFLKQHHLAHYEERHRIVADSGEAEMINSFAPAKCPYCGRKPFHFKKSGFTKSGVQRYKCTCGRTFLPTTGTIFDEHRISISEWMEYCQNLFRHVSLSADSWNNKNAITTSQYWLHKVFMTLEGVQDGIILSGEVWLDETFYSVRKGDKTLHSDGKQLRGTSRNQYCIGVATDKKQTVFLVEGLGKPTQKKTWDTFKDHIAPGSVLIHDGDSSHNRLVEAMNLESRVYLSKSTKGLPDKENPLYPVNHAHAILKHFLNSHGSFNRNDLQGYIDLFAFVTNPPKELLEKTQILLKRAFENPKSLHYRDYFAAKSRLSEGD